MAKSPDTGSPEATRRVGGTNAGATLMRIHRLKPVPRDSLTHFEPVKKLKLAIFSSPSRQHSPSLTRRINRKTPLKKLPSQFFHRLFMGCFGRLEKVMDRAEWVKGIWVRSEEWDRTPAGMPVARNVVHHSFAAVFARIA